MNRIKLTIQQQKNMGTLLNYSGYRKNRVFFFLNSKKFLGFHEIIIQSNHRGQLFLLLFYVSACSVFS